MLDLEFEPLTRAVDAPEVFTVAVLNSGALRVGMSAEAWGKLGRPPALVAFTAESEGVGYLRLAPGDPQNKDHWPVTARKAPRGAKVSATVRIEQRRFTPGVVHRATPVAFAWADGVPIAVVLTLPNWERMLDDIQAAAGEADDEEEAGGE
jgi:hypothetical protein